MGMESIYKLSLIMSMVDKMSGPMSQVELTINGSMTKLTKSQSMFGSMLKANLLSGAIMGGVKALGNAISGLGSAFVDAMKSGVEYNAQMESYNTSFTTMLGDQAQAQQLVNDLKKEAAATPFGMQDLASSVQTMMGFGMSASDAQKHMKELGDISQGNAERFQSLSLAFAQVSSAGKLSGQDLLQMINAGFNPLNEISKMTGKSVGELKSEMEKGAISADMVAAAMQNATSAGGTFYGSMAAQSKTFSGQMSTLEDNFASLKGQVSQGVTSMLAGNVLPMVNGWLGQLSDAFEKGGAQGLIDAFGGILQEAVGFISDQLPMVVDVASKIIIALVQGLAASLPKITDAAVQLLMTLISGIVGALPVLASSATQMIATILSGIASALPQLIPAGVAALKQIIQGILDNLPLVLDAALQLILGLAEGIIDAIPQLVAALPDVINGIIGFLIEAIPQIIDAGITLLVALVEALPTIIASIVQALPKIISGIVNGLIGNIDKIIAAGVQLFIALITNLPTIIIEIVKAIPTIITAIVDGFGQFFAKMGEVGLNLIKGLWQGISDAGAWLWEKISGFFGGVVDNIKNFFGIHSPSTLFAEMGGYMGQGIGVGFEDAMKTVSTDMQNAIPTSFDVGAGLNVSGNLDNIIPFKVLQQAAVSRGLVFPSGNEDTGDMSITASAVREPIQKVSFREVFTDKQTSKKSTEKNRGMTIQKLIFNIDISKIKDIDQLMELLREIEDYANSNGNVDTEEASA